MFTSMRTPTRLVATVCTMLLMVACDPSDQRPPPTAVELPAAAVEPEPATQPDPPEGTGELVSATQPPVAFEDATLRQEELRGAAMTALDADDLGGAIAALDSLAATPEMSELKASGLMLLAELHHQLGDGERAISILQELVSNAPPMAEFEFVLGRTLGELNRLDQAEPHLRRAIELRPDFLQSYLYLGSLLVVAGRESEAADVYLSYEQVLAFLIAQAEEPQTSLPARLSVIEALSYANPDERITRSLIRLLADENVVINGAAIQVLAEVGTIEAADYLRAYAGQTSYEELRIAALRAIDRIRERFTVP